jgi:hypothetical protein
MVTQRIVVGRAVGEHVAGVSLTDRRRRLELQFLYDPQGLTSAIEVTGGRIPFDALAGLMPMLFREFIAQINLVKLIEEIQVIDLITHIDTISSLDTINHIGSLHVIDGITMIDEVALVDRISLLDRITLIDAITNIGTIGTITTLTGITNPINVKTSGATNIVLDLLTQGAYTERRSTLSNQGASASWYYATGNERYSKFFPRGCRGFISSIDFWCKDAGASGGTITVYISPKMGMGPVYSGTITVPAGGAAATRSWTPNISWSYDSLFVFWVSSSTDIQVGYDAGTPNDSFYSTDAGATWTAGAVRWWIQIQMAAETCGDVPVSGIINNIEIPNVAGIRRTGAITVVAQTEELDTIQLGAGRLLYAAFYAGSANDRDDLIPRLYCDGVNVMPFDNTMATQQTLFITATSPGVTIGVWDTTNHYYTIIVTSPFPFKRSLQLGFFNDDLAANRSGFVYYVYEKIS